MRILVVEDERKLANFLKQGLVEEGFAVDVVTDGDEALLTATSLAYDALVLDIMLPGRDGLSILKLLREKSLATPVLLLTARGEVSERVEGLMLGADDYVSKPFAMDELVARVHALSRRTQSELAAVLKVEDLTINLLTREVQRAGERIELAVR